MDKAPRWTRNMPPSNAVSNRQLLEMARAWVAANYPGCPLEYISIHCRHLSAAVRLADGPPCPLAATPSSGDAEAPPSSGGDEATAEEERSGDRTNGVNGCLLEILVTLKEVGQPLTEPLLRRQMAKRGYICHERTIKRRLAELMADGTIENPPGARPPGYRLVCPELFDSVI